MHPRLNIYLTASVHNILSALPLYYRGIIFSALNLFYSAGKIFIYCRVTTCGTWNLELRKEKAAGNEKKQKNKIK